MGEVVVDDRVNFYLACNLLELPIKKGEMVRMNLIALGLHDERFSGWSVKDRLERFHFSTQYLRFCRDFECNPFLYCFHQSVKEKQVFDYFGQATIKVFPVRFRFPALCEFGNDHNPAAILREMIHDQPDVVHFHNYRMFSFPYTAQHVKRKLQAQLAVQQHGYYHSGWKQLLYSPSLASLRMADLIYYSYKPEEELYRKLGILDRAIRIPIPGIDPSLFKVGKKQDSNHLLYVGRISNPRRGGEKKPHLLLFIMRRLLQLGRDVRLTLIGDGPGLSYSKRLASELEIERHVRFLGYLAHGELAGHYRDAALTLVPMELCGVDGWVDGAVQESLACGTAVAAFKASPRFSLKGRFGFLLSKRVDKAAEELSTLLDSPESLEEVARQGSDFVHEWCTEAQVAEKLRAGWEGLMRG